MTSVSTYLSALLFVCQPITRLPARSWPYQIGMANRILQFVCKDATRIQKQISVTHTKVLVSPNSFPLNHCEPVVYDLVYLRQQQSDTVNEQEIALVTAEGIFVGWVGRLNINTVQGRILGGEVLVRKINQVANFYWANGGGQCKRGQLTLSSAD